MSDQETANSPQVKLLRSFFEGIGKRDVDSIADQVHKDFRRVNYPRSVSRPECDKEGWIQRVTELFGL